MNNQTGILLVNLGTPAEPTPQAIRRYLKEFLSDRQVIRLPRLIWLPLLYGIILPLRPKRIAKLYKSIWTEQGAPLLVYSQKIQQQLQEKLGDDYQIELAMRYGEPSIAKGLEKLSQCSSITVLPLFPQYSTTTTESVILKSKQEAKELNLNCSLHFVKSYHDHPTYIDTLAQSIQKHWQDYGQSDYLLLSYHGIPKQYVALGDPYYQECQITTQKLVARLNLTQEQYKMCFQSRFGPAQWLQPYTDETLTELAKSGSTVDVICPGFAVDCLETWEEIDTTYKELFLSQGGKGFRYIPALNDSQMQIELLSSVIEFNNCYR